jgi:formylglycine-generating enzyme required for sulfatase activity
MYAAALVAIVLSAEPNDSQRELLTTFRNEFVLLTPGTGKFPAEFMMGHSQENTPQSPAHRVKFDYHFSIAKYELPQNLWESLMGNNPSRWKGKRNSCEMFSLGEAEQFCRKATELMRSMELIKQNEVIRLPTEAEWEYAARAGTTTEYSFGDDDQQLGDYAWFNGNARGNDPAVGEKKPNDWGLYDVHGYLWEWCADQWHADYQGAPTDGSAWLSGGKEDFGVLRGGSWRDDSPQLTSSYRRPALKSTRSDAVGLRCVLSTE